MYRALSALVIVLAAGPPGDQDGTAALPDTPTAAGEPHCHTVTTRWSRWRLSNWADEKPADDFVPSSDSISVITTSGVYLSTLRDEVDPTRGCRQRVVDPVPDPLDRIQIRIYEDGANDGYAETEPGFPAALFAERFASSTGAAWGAPNEGSVTRTEDADGPNTLYFGADELTDEEYQIDLSADPITGLVLDGRRYWIEITNRLQWEYDCDWAINTSLDGNDHMAVDYIPGYFAYPGDLTFCLDTGFIEPAAPTGVCCGRPSGDCTDASAQFDCLIAGGGWIMNDTCASARATGRCPLGGVPNDTCDTPLEIGPGKDIDADPAATTVTIATFHQATTTSLPDLRLCADTTIPHECLSACDTEGGSFIGDDLWYSYIPPMDGDLVINSCQVWFSWDSMLAIYKGPDGTGVCPCPTDLASCEESAFPNEWGWTADDEGCTPFYWGGPAWLTRPVTAGTCYLIQMGSYNWPWPPAGDGYLSIRFQREPFADPPELCPNDFAEATNGDNGERLSRFGCIKALAPPAAAGTGLAVAVKVGLKTLYNTTPGDPDGADVCPSRTLLTDPKPGLQQFDDQVRYLGAPQAYHDDASPQPAMYIAAPLVCTAEEADVRDWSPTALAAEFPNADAGRIYFWGDTLVPCSVYELYFCTDPLDDNSCSEPATLYVSAKTGDTWPSFGGLANPGFIDINALVNKYKGIPFTPGATPKGGPPEWHALQAGNVFTLSGKLTSFLDISRGVDGYKGLPYKEQGPCDPDTGVDSCGKPCSTAPGD